MSPNNGSTKLFLMATDTEKKKKWLKKHESMQIAAMKQALSSTAKPHL